jgi:Domain of unknown function (DUF4267)
VGARNTAISLLALLAAFTGARLMLASIFTSIAMVAGLDFIIVSGAAGTGAAIKHAAFTVIIAGISLWTLRSQISADRQVRDA